MKRKLISLVLVILAAGLAIAALPVRTSRATLDIDSVSGAWDQFDWRWGESETTALNVYLTTNNTGVDASSTVASFKLSRQDVTSTVAVMTVTNMTISTSNLTYTIASTSMPSAGVYLLEIYGWNTSTNYRTYGQGRVTVFRSLY